MLRWVATGTLVGIVVVLAGPARGERLGKGHSLVLVGISGHRAQIAYPQSYYTFPFETGEVGGTIAYQRFLTDQWTVGISGGYHGSRTENDGHTTLGVTHAIDTRSFTLRIGGDRYAFIDDHVAVYLGAGAFVTGGRARKELVSGMTNDGPYSREVGLNGRIGVYVGLARGTGLYGHVGQVLSRTWVEDPGGGDSWSSNTREGSLGMAFHF